MMGGEGGGTGFLIRLNGGERKDIRVEDLVSDRVFDTDEVIVNKEDQLMQTVTRLYGRIIRENSYSVIQKRNVLNITNESHRDLDPAEGNGFNQSEYDKYLGRLEGVGL